MVLSHIHTLRHSRAHRPLSREGKPWVCSFCSFLLSNPSSQQHWRTVSVSPKFTVGTCCSLLSSLLLWSIMFINTTGKWVVEWIRNKAPSRSLQKPSPSLAVRLCYPVIFTPRTKCNVYQGYLLGGWLRSAGCPHHPSVSKVNGRNTTKIWPELTPRCSWGVRGTG